MIDLPFPASEYEKHSKTCHEIWARQSILCVKSTNSIGKLSPKEESSMTSFSSYALLISTQQKLQTVVIATSCDWEYVVALEKTLYTKWRD